MSSQPCLNGQEPVIDIPIICDPLPGTLHGCLQELKRYEECQQQLEKYRRVMLARMDDLLRGQTETQLRDMGENNPKNDVLTGIPEMVESDCFEKEPSVIKLDENQYTENFDKEAVIKLRTCNFLWDDLNVLSDFSSDHDTMPIISVLDKLKWQNKEKQQITKWCSILTKLFFHCNGTGVIEEGEYVGLVQKLPISIDLKDVLFTKFSRIDHDSSGAINLTEFLYFFLQSKAFRDELNTNGELNELLPSAYLPQNLKHIQSYIYNVVTDASYNKLSIFLFSTDTALTLVPCVTLIIEAICPTDREVLERWNEEPFLWVATVFFAAEYVLGFLTCETKREYVRNFYHVIELISFLPWIVYEGGRYTGKEICPKGFVFFRVLRFFKLAEIFPHWFGDIVENLNLYCESLKLAYVSHKAFGMFILYMTLYISLLIYIFERGEYDSDDNVWKRAGEDNESPFANFFNCFYFTIVTGTTLGYGEMYPRTYVGKLLSLLVVLMGLVNLTFTINTIGECLEEVLRRFLQNRSALIDEERLAFIRGEVAQSQKTLDLMEKKHVSHSRLSNVSRYAPLDAFILKERNSLFNNSDL